MDQFRVYLKSELGKLGHNSGASDFLNHIPPEVASACRISNDPPLVVDAFSSQQKVNAFVDALSETDLKLLTKGCDKSWRKNGVYEALKTGTNWTTETLPVNQLYVRQAEPDNKDIFERNDFSLVGIAFDKELWKRAPYVEKDYLNKDVAFPVVLAERWKGRTRVFDGIHRAIILTKKGRLALSVCQSKTG